MKEGGRKEGGKRERERKREEAREKGKKEGKKEEWICLMGWLQGLNKFLDVKCPLISVPVHNKCSIKICFW